MTGEGVGRDTAPDSVAPLLPPHPRTHPGQLALDLARDEVRDEVVEQVEQPADDAAGEVLRLGGMPCGRARGVKQGDRGCRGRGWTHDVERANVDLPQDEECHAGVSS